MKHDPTTRHMLERAPAPRRRDAALIANSGPMTPPQRRAMWAKKNDPNQASPSDRPYIPVPRVPIPGYEPKPPKGSGASEVIYAERTPPEPTPKESEYDKIMRRVAEIRARGGGPTPQTIGREDAQNMPRRSDELPYPYNQRAALPPGHSIFRGMQPGGQPPSSGIWAGKDYDPTKPWKQKRTPKGGVINNRATAALHFLEQFR